MSITLEGIIDICLKLWYIIAITREVQTMELDPKYADVIRRRWAEFKYGEGCDWQALTPAAAKNNITTELPAEPQSGDQD